MITYIGAILLIVAGIVTLLIKENLVKKLIGLVVFTNGVHLLYISAGARLNGMPALLEEISGTQLAAAVVDPLPQALVLTSIVINFSIAAVALSLIVQIYRKFNTLEANKVRSVKG